jgi:hypothetical protein
VPGTSTRRRPSPQRPRLLIVHSGPLSQRGAGGGRRFLLRSHQAGAALLRRCARLAVRRLAVTVVVLTLPLTCGAAPWPDEGQSLHRLAQRAHRLAQRDHHLAQRCHRVSPGYCRWCPVATLGPRMSPPRVTFWLQRLAFRNLRCSIYSLDRTQVACVAQKGWVAPPDICGTVTLTTVIESRLVIHSPRDLSAVAMAPRPRLAIASLVPGVADARRCVCCVSCCS